MFLRKLVGVIAVAAIVVTIPPVILLSNLYFLVTPAFLRLEYGKPGFPESPGFTSEERLRQAEATLTYLRSWQGVDALQQLEHKGTPLYNVREVIHLADVKWVVSWAFVVHAIALVIFLLAFIYVLWRADLRAYLPVAIFWGCLALVVPLLGMGAFAYINFDLFFVTFHQLFFTGDSWLFPGSDSLIRLFPLPFWTDAATIWIVFAAGEAVLAAAAAYLWPGWKHGR